MQPRGIKIMFFSKKKLEKSINLMISRNHKLTLMLFDGRSPHYVMPHEECFLKNHQWRMQMSVQLCIPAVHFSESFRVLSKKDG